ncbi:MAG TPA: VanZ family protein [Candidatus Bathyarchaeia archaeon]|nr:VanZ family protein [Candidatus Bathyarchaeia archaeon]
MRFEKFVSCWLPVLVWAAVIFYLSSVPNLRASTNPYWDEIFRSCLHGIFYAIFALLWLRPLKPLSRLKRYSGAVVVGFLYALSDELHQRFVPTRAFQIKDLVIDTGGLLAGVVMAAVVLPKAPEGIRSWAQKLDLV